MRRLTQSDLPGAWYAHEKFGRVWVRLDGRDPRTWDGRGGWYYVGASH